MNMLTANDLQSIRQVIREEVQTQIKPIEIRLDTHDQHLAAIDKRFDRVDRQLIALAKDQKKILKTSIKLFNFIDKDFSALAKRIHQVESCLGPAYQLSATD